MESRINKNRGRENKDNKQMWIYRRFNNVCSYNSIKSINVCKSRSTSKEGRFGYTEFRNIYP